MRHPAAIVECRLPDSCSVGPFAVVGPDVRLGEGVTVGAHALVTGRTTLGDGVSVGPSAVLGTEPQDLKYAGEDTELVIGERTVIREFADINRGTAATGRTEIGADCLVMAYAHVAHDCRIGRGVILANSVNLAGHVEIGEYATIGGVVPVHQFVRIGAYSMIGGGFRVPMDVPPFCLAGGYPLRAVSLNRIGLRRRGFDPARLDLLDRAFRRLFRDDGPVAAKAEAMIGDDSWGGDARLLAAFILESRRGVISS